MDKGIRAPKVHELKTDPDLFEQSWEGNKPWEIRFDDRGFKIGDKLMLKETRYTGDEMTSGQALHYTGRVILCEITYILTDQYGLKDGWAVITVEKLTQEAFKSGGND